MEADSAARAAPAVALLAGAWTALAAGVSFGAVAFAGASGPRIGVIPNDPLHVALAMAAGAVVAAIGWRRGRGLRAALAVSPLALAFLPWLPFPVPPAFLIWTGALVSLAWIAAALALGAVVLGERSPTRLGRWLRRVAAPLRGSAALAGVLSFALFSTAAWLASPSLPAGDEPHYLVITQSLLYDHDLKIENNHQRGDYRAYFSGDLLPHYIRRGRNGAIYSIHAPGLPTIVLPAFALAGYRGVVLFLLIVSASACALAWWLAWRVTNDVAAAWFGWAAVTLSAPFFLESYTVLPDGPGAAVVLTGVWALLRADWEREGAEGREEYAGGKGALPWFLHGLALALLPWMHTRFVVIAATLGGLVLVRLAHASNPLSKAVAFLTAPAVSALGWLFFFVLVYGVPDPTAPYGGDTQNSFVYLANGLGGLLFDQGFGLFATAPVLLIAFAGFVRARRLGIRVGRRRGAISAGHHHVSDVVGGNERPRAVPRPDASAARDSSGVRLESRDVARRADADGRRARRQRVARLRDGRRRRRTSGLPRAERKRPDHCPLDGVGEFRRRSAVGISGVRTAAWEAHRSPRARTRRRLASSPRCRGYCASAQRRG